MSGEVIAKIILEPVFSKKQEPPLNPKLSPSLLPVPLHLGDKLSKEIVRIVGARTGLWMILY
jgi:hypothetical protein